MFTLVRKITQIYIDKY